jgi:hypothetical protein
LVTQTLLRDLGNPARLIASLALRFVANLGNTKICPATAAAVKQLMQNDHRDLMKRAEMVTVRVVQNGLDLTDDYKNAVQLLLKCSNHGVRNAGIDLVCAMTRVQPKLAKRGHNPMDVSRSIHAGKLF